ARHDPPPVHTRLSSMIGKDLSLGQSVMKGRYCVAPGPWLGAHGAWSALGVRLAPPEEGPEHGGVKGQHRPGRVLGVPDRDLPAQFSHLHAVTTLGCTAGALPPWNRADLYAVAALGGTTGALPPLNSGVVRCHH